MELLARCWRWLPLPCLLWLGCAGAARAQENSVSVGINNLIIQGENNQYFTSLDSEIIPAPAYEYSITGNVHGEGPLFSELVPASEPAAEAFNAIHNGLSAVLSGSVSNPGAQLPATLLQEQVTSGTDGFFNARFGLSIDESGLVSFAVSGVTISIGGQPDTTDRLVFDSGSVTVTALTADVSVTTLGATDITSDSASLQAAVTCPNNFQAWFIYRTGTALSATSGVLSVSSTGTVENVSIPVTGLLPHKLYYYHAVVEDVTGPVVGNIGAFRTADVFPVSGTFSAFAGVTPLFVPVLAHSSDADGAALKVIGVINGPSGRATVKPGGGGVTYQFTSRTAATGQFSYTVADPYGGTSTGEVNMVNYATLAGTYAGVLLNQQEAAAGYLRVALAATGACTGSLTIAGASYPFAGALDSSGSWSKTIGVTAAAGPVVTLALLQSGSAYELDGGAAMGALSFDASLLPATPGAPAYYTMSLPPPPDVLWAGSGYATVGVAASGLASVAGAMPDGAAFSCQAVVDAAGQAAVFSPLYSGSNRGTLAGTLAFSGSAAVSGTLVWTKPSQSSALIDPGPFTVTLTGSGERYVAPQHAAALQFGVVNNTGQIAVSGGNLLAPITHNLEISPANVVTILGPGNPTLALTLSPAGGLFSGHFVDLASGKTRTLHGVLLQASQAGEGYFLGSSAGGTVSIGP